MSVPRKTVLLPGVHDEQLRTLGLAAIALRRRLLKLGNDRGIRLHYGAYMSMIEIIVVLYLHWLNVRPEQPDWSGRDRFVLSKGHAAPVLYAVLSLCGFFRDEEFAHFRTLGSILQGHPDRTKTPGLDSCSGSLGQGMPVACGMALAAKIDQSAFRVYAVMSDGECNEGSVWEAALIAANLGIDRITVMLDRNGKSSYGQMAGRNDVEPLADKWRAFGWEVFECNGHDIADLTRRLAAAETVRGRPSVIICRTVKGKGIPYIEAYDTRSNIALTQEQYSEAMACLDKAEAELSNGRG